MPTALPEPTETTAVVGFGSRMSQLADTAGLGVRQPSLISEDLGLSFNSLACARQLLLAQGELYTGVHRELALLIPADSAVFTDQPQSPEVNSGASSLMLDLRVPGHSWLGTIDSRALMPLFEVPAAIIRTRGGCTVRPAVASTSRYCGTADLGSTGLSQAEAARPPVVGAVAALADSAYPVSRLIQPVGPIRALDILGADTARPTRSNNLKTMDVVAVGGRAAGLAPVALAFANAPLLTWSVAWPTRTSTFAYSLDRAKFGGVLGRPHTGFWSRSWVNEPFFGRGSAAVVADKGAVGTESLPVLPRREVSVPLVPALVPVADVELSLWAPTLAAVTPITWDDLDVSFVYRQWAPEITTTRRSDHNSAYGRGWSERVRVGNTGLRSSTSVSAGGNDAWFAASNVSAGLGPQRRAPMSDSASGLVTLASHLSP